MRLSIPSGKLTVKNLVKLENPSLLLLMEMNFGLLLPKKLMLKLMADMSLLLVEVVVQH
jgi:hypothetical protein